jgi:hypothetical protein
MEIGRFAFRVPGCGLTSKLRIVRTDAQLATRNAQQYVEQHSNTP